MWCTYSFRGWMIFCYEWCVMFWPGFLPGFSRNRAWVLVWFCALSCFMLLYDVCSLWSCAVYLYHWMEKQYVWFRDTNFCAECWLAIRFGEVSLPIRSIQTDLPRLHKTYVGQTGSQFSTRYKEHMAEWRNISTTSSFAKQLILETHSSGSMKKIMEIVHCYNKGP
jgi:hypothetical protein